MAVIERPLDQVSSEDLFRAAMAPEPEPQPEPQPAAPEPASAEPPQPTPPPKAEPEAGEEYTGIPPWRLKEETEARRLAEDRARLLEERLTQIATHLQQNQKQPDFFDNPDQATQALILRTLRPYVEENQRVVMYNSKLAAEALHGSKKVADAEEAFLKAREMQALDPADYEAVVQSPNRYHACVQWHTKHHALTTVGSDPEAWFQKTLEARMADPQFQAKLFEQVRGGAAGRPGIVDIPPSLSKATAAASNRGDPAGDGSEASLWRYATKR